MEEPHILSVSDSSSDLDGAGGIRNTIVPLRTNSREFNASSTLTSPLALSTGSVATVRNNTARSPNVVLRTPSYPFPIIGVESGTPLETPPTHLPFTALSPTTGPEYDATASRLAKSKVADEFKSSGRMTPSTMHPGVQSLTDASTAPQLPDPYSISIRLQTEPGLAGWWQQLSLVLRESFHASKATLAVPSDKTEIENVPWAQLAEYIPSAEEDRFSRIATEHESTRSSLSGSFISEGTPGENPQEKQNTTKMSASASASARPKLDSRHSYAGSTQKSPANEAPIAISKRPKPSRAETHASVIGGIPDARAHINLERLGWSSSEGIFSPLSEDTTTSSLPSARILDVQRSLEADPEPLITSAGVVRALNNSSATVLTRRYNVIDESLQSSPINAKISSRGSSTQLHSGEATGSKPRQRTRSGTSSTMRSSANSSSDSSKRRNDPRAVYEDYEQVPGTPWAQSPAPSPAAIAETDDNPFFSSASVRDSFRKNPPSHLYTAGQQFEPIGLDTSYSIIQLPLVHPSTVLSQPQRLHRFRIDKGKDKNGKHTGNRQPSMERKRKIPLAILSILAPVVPYPHEFVQMLNSLSPMLATSFYAASQHSNLQKEVSGLAHERQRANARPANRLGQTESAGSEIFSPMSASSSEYTTSGTPQGQERASLELKLMEQTRTRARTPGARTPLSHMSRDGYFAANLANETRQEQTAPAKQQVNRSNQGHSTSQKKPSAVLHSHGATFHKTHPSLPVATSVGQSEDEHSESEHGGRPFKEPSPAMLRSMIDIGATQHLIAEPDSGNLVWVNSKFQAYRKTSAGLPLDDQLWNNIYHKDRRNIRREWTHALETGEQLSQQVRLERFDGQFRWFHIKFLPLKNEVGVIKYWSGQAMDIHDLHEAEVKAAKSKEKAASEAKYRAIANSLPVIVFAASVPSGMTFANTQWLSYSGQSLEEALGFGFLNHVHPEDLNKCRFPGMSGNHSASPHKVDNKHGISRSHLERADSAASSAGDSDATSAATETTVRAPATTPALEDALDLQLPNELLKTLANDGIILCARDGQGNLSITTEMRLKSKDDEYRWHLVQGSYIQSVNFGSGDAQWFIACTDISNQKKIEAKIQEANSALENVNAALEREMQQKMGYLSSMSHEIRTPLNSIMGNLQFLIQSGLDESALEWVHGAKEAATGMHELINDILDLSKAEAKMLRLQSYWFNPRDICEQVMDILNPKAAGKKVELCTETSNKVPSDIRGDAGRIKQVLLNLATNAIKFTNQGEVIVRCEVQGNTPVGVPPLKDNEILVRWVVTDTGIGFSSEDKQLLFKAYSQIKNKATRDTVGTGLGLILCKTMVNLHGGDIDASSVPGQGSTFTFFARFRTRHDTVGTTEMPSALHSPGIPGSNILPKNATHNPHIASSPASMNPSNGSQDSPTLLSDSSSAFSIRSSTYQKSIRSSMSTMGSSRPESPLKLSLPSDSSKSMSRDLAVAMSSPITPTTLTKLQQQENTAGKRTSVKAEPLTPATSNISAKAPTSSRASSITFATSDSKKSGSLEDDAADTDRASFRPPMLSVLVVCPPIQTRRITCERIQGIVPRSAPCNIASEGTFAAAEELLFGDEPVLFTHIVIRTVNNDDALELVERVLTSVTHSKACLVLLTDQDQFLAIKQGLPNVDFDALNQTDRLKRVVKPAHASKLAKIFDPFNENRTVTSDPKETKRKAGERRAKEDFKLFKTALGAKDMRILAVEDDKMQMNILNSFLSKVCGISTTLAYNGQQSLDLYLQNGPGYFSVIVSDTEMPGMNGLTMCRHIRREEAKRGWPPINMISLSANVLTKGWTEAADAGFSQYCAKPVTFSELGRILIELTDLRQPHVYLRDRPKPKALLKALGEYDSEEDEDDDNGEMIVGSYPSQN